MVYKTKTAPNSNKRRWLWWIVAVGIILVALGSKYAALRKEASTVDYRSTVNELPNKPIPAIELVYTTTDEGVTTNFSIYLSRAVFLDALDDARYTITNSNWDETLGEVSVLNVDPLLLDLAVRKRVLEYALSSGNTCLVLDTEEMCQPALVKYQDGFVCGPLCGSGTYGWETVEGKKLTKGNWIS